MEVGLPQQTIAGGQETKDIDWNRKFLMDVRNNFSPTEDSQEAEQIAERGCAVFTPRDSQDDLAQSHIWPSFKQEIGPETSLHPFQPEWFSAAIEVIMSGFWGYVRWPLNWPVYKYELPSCRDSLTGLVSCVRAINASLFINYIYLCYLFLPCHPYSFHLT